MAWSGPGSRVLRLGAPRLPPAAWYPAGDALASARHVRLASGLGMRVVEAGDPAAAPVLLLHGWACSAFTWRHQLDALARTGYRAHAIDLKGHGQSDKPLGAQEYTREAMTRFALEAADALGLDRFALVGHSLGGGIASRLALEHPDRVARLALVSAVGFGRVPFVPLVRGVPRRPLEQLLPYVVPYWLYRLILWGVTGNLRPYSREDVAEYWAATQYPEFPVVLWRLAREYAWDELAPDERRRLAMPLLVIYGSDDLVVRRRRGGAAAGAREAMAEAGAGAEAHVIARAGHAAHEEAPEQVTQLLLGFLEPWRAEGARVGRPASAG